jgi:Cu/Ag efflux protein CusF
MSFAAALQWRIRVAAIFALTALAASGASPYAGGGRKPIAFSGRVESVDLKLGTVAVKHGAIPGYMPAMTLDYMVDKDALLKQLSPADEITATVYVGDPTLHDLHVVNPGSSGRHR